MNVCFLTQGWEDYTYWQANDPKLLGRINELLRDIIRSPFKGIGKPEPLRENWSGWWSRRIDNEHRLIYRVSGKGEMQMIEIVQCRYHYS